MSASENVAAQTGPGPKLKVFVSYSRRDAAFADQLVSGLELCGFDAYFDTEDIAPGEPWKERLGRLIRDADTVVFVLSPSSIASKICVWELAETERLSKRLLPIVRQHVPDNEVPNQLRNPNWIFFTEDRFFLKNLGELASALRTDLEWIREHTRFAELATSWVERGRSPGHLLPSGEIDNAQAWLAKRPKEAPQITMQQQTFIDASIRAAEMEQKRRWRAKIIMGGLAFVILAGLIGWLNQAYLQERLRWFTIIRPYKQAQIRPLTAEAERALKSKDRFRECTEDCPEMVVVPAGKFMMGSPSTENPKHEVTVAKSFAVSKYEVTFNDWDACVAYGDCPQVTDEGWGRGRQPVINVSWDDAQTYVAWLRRMTGKTYRLLSEAEWEYAARAGTVTTYSWGNEIGKGKASCFDCGSRWDGRQTAPVGSFAANAFELHDMHGNVWEWVEDCLHGNYEGAPKDGSAWIAGGDCNKRILRGGSFNSNSGGLRSAARNADRTEIRLRVHGFRIARTLTP
jgi:formylglycine-generating enzyme required for sulfatase activity